MPFRKDGVDFDANDRVVRIERDNEVIEAERASRVK